MHRSLIVAVSFWIASGGLLARAADGPLQLSDVRLGAWWPGTDEESRWLVLRATVTNQSDSELTVPVKSWRLTADGDGYASGELSSPSVDVSIFIGGDLLETDDFEMRELKIAPGKSEQTWVTFPNLPPGTHVPGMTLECRPTGGQKLNVDVNATYAARLKLSTEQLGPGDELVLMKVDGTLNSVNVQTLANAIDRQIAKGLFRFVVSIADAAEPPDFEVLDWLHQVARTSGQSEMYHDRFPSLPSERITLHLVNPAIEAGRGSPADTWWERNIHAELANAVSAAVLPLCRQKSRGSLLNEIRNGHALSRAAVLIHGAEKLATADLPLIIRFSNDESSKLREAALLALRHFGEDDAIDTLVRHAASDNADFATAAVESLATSRYTVAHEKLTELLALADADQRRRVLLAMTRTPRQIWSEPLFRLASEGDRAARAQALSALTAVGHPHLHAVLRQSLADDDASLSAAALEQLMKRNDPESEQLALQWTLRQLETTAPTRNVLSFLKRTHDARAVPLLMKHFGEPSKQRVALVGAILMIGDELAALEFADRIDELNNAEQRLVIGALHSASSPRFRPLAEKVMNGESRSLVDVVAALLATDASPWAIDLISTAMTKATKKKRFAPLCDALASTGTAEARRLLREAATSKEKRFRGAARQALEMLYQSSPAMQFVIQGQSAWQDESNATLALLYLDLAVEVDPELPAARLERGNAIMRLPSAPVNRLQTAREDFARLVEISPNDSFGHTGLGLVDVRLGSVDRGISAGEKLREKHKGDPVYLYNMACIYARAIESLKSRDTPPENSEKLISDYEQKALRDLAQSIDSGLDEYNVEWMARDPDLKTIHSNPQFEQLFEPADNEGAALPEIPAEEE